MSSPAAHRGLATGRGRVFDAAGEPARWPGGPGHATAARTPATRLRSGRAWRLRNRREQIHASLARLEERGDIVRCELLDGDKRIGGWIKVRDLSSAASP